MNWLRNWWRSLRCPHANVKGIYGDERLMGYRWRCLDCGLPTNGIGSPTVAGKITWLARLTGVGGKFGVEREFQNGRSDLSRSGKTGTITYIVTDGIYEANEGRKRLGRSWYKVTGDTVETITEDDALTALGALTTATSTPDVDPATDAANTELDESIRWAHGYVKRTPDAAIIGIRHDLTAAGMTRDAAILMYATALVRLATTPTPTLAAIEDMGRRAKSVVQRLDAAADREEPSYAHGVFDALRLVLGYPRENRALGVRPVNVGDIQRTLDGLQ